MKKIILLISTLSFLPFTNIYPQWIQLTSPSTNNLYCTYFNNALTGYLGGATVGNVIKTTDGGVSWLFTSTGTSNTFYDIVFLDLLNGFVVGSNKQVIRTTNGGGNWNIKTSGTGTHYSISFPSATVGYAAGGFPTVIDKSLDGGNNWTAITPPTSNTLRGVFFVNSTVGWFCGYSGTIWKTTDGGISWIPQTQSSSYNFEKIYFKDLSTGFVVGSNGTILKTTNGGTSWNAVSSGTTNYLYNLYYISPNICWAIGASGKIQKTTDDGNTWYQQNSPSGTATYYGIHMVDANTGYIVGSGGILLKTTNGGGVITPPVFQKITTGSIVTDQYSCTGAAWGDYDNDGYQDLVVTPWNDNCWSCNYPILMYHNNGNGTFTRVTNNIITQITTKAIGLAWGDYDNDGRLDLFMARHLSAGLNNLLFHNEGNGNFTQVTTGIIVNDGDGLCPAWSDYDRDGWLDLFLAKGFDRANALYHNNGNGTFTKVTSGGIVNDIAYSRGCAWGDYDNDGWPDLFVVNYEGQNDFLYHNNGNGTFTRILSGPEVNDGLWGSTCAWADYDNDGKLDLFVTNNNTNNKLFHNDGENNFTLTSLQPSLDGGFSYGANWTDYNNDMFIELFAARVGLTNLLYRNNGGSSFTFASNEIVTQEGTLGQTGVWGDYNNDGKMDLFVTNMGGGSVPNYLYRNIGTSGNYLICKLRGCVLNKSAIGARIKIRVGNLYLIREISGGNMSQNMLWQHFGLGNNTVVDSIIVYWTTGNIQILTNVAANQSILIDECLVGVTNNNNNIPDKYELLQNYPNPFNPITTIEYSIIKSTNVRLSVYDIDGRLLKVLVDQKLSEGNYKTSFDGTGFASGVYIYKIETDEFASAKKMILMK